MAFGKEIKRIREASGVTASALVAAIGLDSLPRYKGWEHSDSTPKFDDRVLIESYFNMPLDEIMKLENIPAELLHNDGNKSKDSYLEKRRNQKNNAKEDVIPFYEVGASAGVKSDMEILPVDKKAGVLKISDLFKGSQYALRVAGNSMTPNYPPGSIIGISFAEMPYINPGTVYVIESVSHELWIKRAFYKNDSRDSQELELTSDNTMLEDRGARKGKLCYPPIYLPFNQIKNIFRVTGIFKSNVLTTINDN